MLKLDIIIFTAIALMIGCVVYVFADEYRQVHYGDPNYANLVDQCYSLKIGPPDPDEFRQLRRTLANATLNHPSTRAPLEAVGLGLGMPDYKSGSQAAFSVNGLTRAKRAQICQIIESNVPRPEGLEAGQPS